MKNYNDVIFILKITTELCCFSSVFPSNTVMDGYPDQVGVYLTATIKMLQTGGKLGKLQLMSQNFFPNPFSFLPGSSCPYIWLLTALGKITVPEETLGVCPKAQDTKIF